MAWNASIFRSATSAISVMGRNRTSITGKMTANSTAAAALRSIRMHRFCRKALKDRSNCFPDRIGMWPYE